MDLGRKLSVSLGVTGIIVGLVGVGAAVLFHQLGKKDRDPVFLVDPVQAEIITAEHIALVPIRVTREDGSEIERDVRAVRFYLWNKGKLPIRGGSVKESGDILESIVVELKDRSATSQILDYRILATSRRNAGIKLIELPQRRAVKIEFTILEYNDGLTGQITYESKGEKGLAISGEIVGVDSIESVDPLERAKALAAQHRMISISGLVYLLTAIFFGYIRLAPLLRDTRDRQAPRAILRALAMPSLVLLMAISMLAMSFWQELNVPQNATAYVPQEIVPGKSF